MRFGSFENIITYNYLLTNVYVYIVVGWLNIVEGDPEALFSIAITPSCRGGYYSSSWIATLTLINTL